MRCIFCNILDNLKILETSNFLLVYDPYPLISGHVLVVSKKHYGCAGEIPEYDDIFFELSRIKDFVKQTIEKKYGFVSFFEHGRAGACVQFGEECHHFHLHILPLQYNLETDIKQHFKQIYFLDYREIKTLFSSYGDYLFFENFIDKKFFFPTKSDFVPPHFLRTLVGSAVGYPEKASWERYPSSDFLKLSKNDLPPHEWVERYNDIFR